MTVPQAAFRTVGIAVTVALAFAVAATLLVRNQANGASPTQPALTYGPLHSVSEQSLAGGRIKLEVVTAQERAGVSITAGQAEQIAKQHSPEGAVVESALVHFEDYLTQPPFKCLCWVVDRTLPTGPFISGPAPIPGEPVQPRRVPVEPFHIDVIDAATGSYIYSAEGSR